MTGDGKETSDVSTHVVEVVCVYHTVVDTREKRLAIIGRVSERPTFFKVLWNSLSISGWMTTSHTAK